MAKVIVYSTPTCPYCKMAKEFLTEQHVAFEDVNVQADQAEAKKMIEKTGQLGVPVLDIDSKIIIGFDKDEIKAALGLK